MPVVRLGRDETGQDLTIGDIERRSGLYVLGKPGMGKSALLVNLGIQDIAHGHGLFFLDPHGDAINDLIKRSSSAELAERASILDPETETLSFGMNLLACRDITSRRERRFTYTRAYNVFHKLWEHEFGPWLQLILQNTLWAFVENQDYTLAEVPLFLNPRHTAFREHILSNVNYNQAVVDFWQYEFFERRPREQQERVDAALTRVTTLLTHPDIRHIIGQRKTTIDFDEILDGKRILFVQLSANLAADIKRFVGTILVSELLHAVRNRQEGKRHQYCIFIDEFQNFASSDDVRTLITEGRKFGITFCACHQERFGQFAENQKVMGATLAAANKVLFQLTVKDAEELAPEFAKEPTTTETRLEPELVISQEPFWDLLRRGHANPKIQEYIQKYWWPIQSHLERRKDVIEEVRGKRTAYLDEATLYRDEASLSQADERVESRYNATIRGREFFPVMTGAIERTKGAIERTREAHYNVQEQNKELFFLQQEMKFARERIDYYNRFLTMLMAGHIALGSGQESLAIFLCYMHIDLANSQKSYTCHQDPLVRFYIDLSYGDPDEPLAIPASIAYKYFPEQQEEAYLQKMRPIREKEHRKSEESKKKERERFGKNLTSLKSVEERLHEDLLHYRQSQVFISIGRASITSKGWYSGPERKYHEGMPQWLPDLPARVFSDEEREILIGLCKVELQKDIDAGLTVKELFQIIDDLVDFCYLLQKPENHIKVASRQYVVKPINIRPVHDMINEMAQELADLPRFTAYAKVIEEREGTQTVLKRKIHTEPLRKVADEEGYGEEMHMLLWENAVRFGYYKERDLIEEEIRERQEKWRNGAMPPDRRVDEEEPPPPIDF